jgi:SAM-dependent methyltransferase
LTTKVTIRPPQDASSASGDAIRSAVDELRRAASRFSELPTRGPAAWLYHQTLEAIHGLLACASAAAEVGAPLDEMRAATEGARRSCARFSRTLAHTQSWPRGYPGDFQLIERLLDAEPGGEPGTLEQVLETCVLQLPIVWQHRAKVAWQAGLVRRRLGGGAAIRVLSIGCGGSRDLMLLEPHELSFLDLVLIDLDAAALDLSASRLNGRVRELTCIRGNALRSASRLSAAGPFDAILIGGLLDYLPERAAQTLLKRTAAMLNPEGLLGATNIAAGSLWRPMLDLLADWTLIERTRDDMVRLLSGSDLTTSLALDDSQITWLATAARTAA